MDKSRQSTILENFRKAKTKRQQKDPVWKELDAFDRNEQWMLKDTAPWLPKPVTNFIHLVKYTKRAALATENPTGKLRAVSPAGIDLVDMLNKAYEDTFQRIKARKVIRDCIETSKLLGTGIAHVYWNENKEGRMGSTVLGDDPFAYEGEIEVRQIDPASFFPDPSAFRIEDCQYIIVRERKSKEWATAKFGNKWKSEDDEASAPEDRGEIYNNRDYDSNQEGKVDFLCYYEKKANEEGGYTYTREYMVNGKIVGEKEKLRPNRYPFSVLYDFPQRQEFWGMSTCQFILDNQKIINKVESVIAMIGTLMQNPQKVVSRHSGIDPQKMQKFGSVPGMTWVSNEDPTKSVHYVIPPQIPMALFNLLDNAKGNIREITGITEAYSGQNVGSLQTSSGVQALIDRSTMRDRDQMYDVEMFVEDFSTLIIDFMTEYYEEERQIRIIGDNPNDYSFVSFRGSDYKDLDYDMFVDVSAKAPITRMRETQEAKELLNMQGQYAQSFPAPLIKGQEAIRMMNLTHGERIIKRMDMDEMQNEAAKIQDVLNMYTEVLGQGVDPMEAQQMAVAMLEQKYNQQGSGSTGGQAAVGGAPTSPTVQNA
jgi:hypothetical protein